MVIKFKNWEKYQKRSKDLRKPFWLSLDNGICTDPKMFELNDAEFRGFIYLLCEASKAHKNGEFFLSFEHYAALCRSSADVLHRTIRKLVELQILEDMPAGSRPGAGASATATRQDKTNNTKKEYSSEERSKAAPVLSEQVRPKTAPVLESLLPLKEDLENRVSVRVQQSWLKNYSAEFITREVRKAGMWLASNPGRNPKSQWSAFYTKWLLRAWEFERKQSYAPNQHSEFAKREQNRKPLSQRLLTDNGLPPEEECVDSKKVAELLKNFSIGSKL